MKFLSWMFFCLSPFALFCSENGNGLVLCPLFIALGFLFKYADNNSSHTQTVKVDPQNFWEWHYKDRMRSILAQKDTISDGAMAIKDQEARQWATTICGYHNAWVPPEYMQEQIARENGVITKEMIKERNEAKDRIQIGKYVLMEELMERNHWKKIEKRWRCCCLDVEIKRDMYKIKMSNNTSIDEYSTHRKYNKSINEIWESLSEEEINQAKKWVEEYNKKLLEAACEYVEEKRQNVNVEMDF